MFRSLLTITRKNKTSKIEDTSLSKIGGKDPTIDLFHAIGKVLYCKREEDKEAERLGIEIHFSHEEEPLGTAGILLI